MKMADKAANYTTYKKMAREDLGDCVKYIKVTNQDKRGKNIKPRSKSTRPRWRKT